MAKNENVDGGKSEKHEAPEADSAKAEKSKSVERTGHSAKDHEKAPALGAEGESQPINASDWIAHEKKIHEGEPDEKRPHAADAKKPAPRSHHAKSEGRASTPKEK